MPRRPYCHYPRASNHTYWLSWNAWATLDLRIGINYPGKLHRIPRQLPSRLIPFSPPGTLLLPTSDQPLRCGWRHSLQVSGTVDSPLRSSLTMSPLCEISPLCARGLLPPSRTLLISRYPATLSRGHPAQQDSPSSIQLTLNLAARRKPDRTSSTE